MMLSVRRRLYNRQEGRCFYCQVYFGDWDKGESLVFATKDHVVPKIDGGTDHISNLVLACEPCNRLKGRLPAADFVRILKINKSPTWKKQVLNFLGL